ncbi:MAG: N-acetylneuraminate synthase family protein [Calditrichaeota bacterium]|nr:N-acetylneuraminate synthase family protein [Calditrichota bacterium]
MLKLENLTEPYLIAEIGINHNGDLQIAKRLIDAAFACDWPCVKFQKRNPDKAVPDHQKDVVRETPWGTMTYLEYKHRIEFGEEEYTYIDKYCQDKPMDWTVSVWDHDSLQFALKFDLPFLKLPSAMLTNEELLVECAKAGLPMIVSTGMSSIEEVDIAVNLLEKHAKSFAIMHTNSSYPCKLEDLNLNVIPALIERYKCTVGYSGHEYDLTPTVLAVALGARIVERHVTLNQKMWGTDQSASVEVMGMDMLRKRVTEAMAALGSPYKRITEAEIPIRKKLRG